MKEENENRTGREIERGETEEGSQRGKGVEAELIRKKKFDRCRRE